MIGLVEAPFGGEIRRFRLLIGSAEEIEQKFDRGLGAVLQAITRENRVDMLREVLRRGLVGGGLDEIKARLLVDTHASTGVVWHVQIASGLIGAILIGDVDDKPGKSEPGQEASPQDPGETGEPTSGHSTAQAP